MGRCEDNTLRYKVYTDGACSGNPGPGGWGVVVSKLVGNEYEVVATFGGCELVATNNSMELKAAMVATQIAIRTAVKNVEQSKVSFEIVSDSAYVVDAVNKHWLEKWIANDWKTTSGSDVKNLWYWKPFAKLLTVRSSDLLSLKFSRCRGHSGDIMNEMADAEAVRQRKLIVDSGR